ncbi:actin-binding protein WASF2-like [Macrobrachium rosenbergii]|uniref:actin-binding protein WASF2-like n=1 Tax=Macrobrachium rosenbergii TaxID=79674 RepID=UPI0034D420B4
MQTTNHFLKAAYQVGPWRITRKVLLFVIVFCVVIVGFGTLILKTHMFNDDWEDFDWDDDDDWEDRISGGDSVLLIIIGLAGLAAVVSCVGCFMASFNSPEQLHDSGSVFTLSGVSQSPPPTAASAPQAVTRQHHRRPPRSHREEVKSYPPTSEYPQGPSYPVNPGYPPHPPPYSPPAPGYPPTAGMVHTGAPPPPHTIADLPPPYTPGPCQPNAKY